MQGDTTGQAGGFSGPSGGYQGPWPPQMPPPPLPYQPQDRFPGPQAYPPYGMPSPPPRKPTPAWMWVIVAVILLLGVFTAIAVPVFMFKIIKTAQQDNAVKKSCFANQRTVDSAVMQYTAANNGDYPRSLKDLVPTWIKETPQCQASGATYIWEKGPPPQIRCSVHGRYDE